MMAVPPIASRTRRINLMARAYCANRNRPVGGSARLLGVRKQYHFWKPASGDGLDAWDVDRLIELSAGLPVHDIAVGSIAELDSVYWFDGGLHRPTVRAVVDHVRLITEVDTTHPIILGPDGRVMDGMHRVARAVLENRSTISAVQFAQLPEPDHRNCDPAELPYTR